MKCGHLWPLVATCNSCGKIIKSSSSQWGLSLAFSTVLNCSQLFSTVLNCSQLFSTVAASQLLFGTVSSALATKTLSMGWANTGCKTKSKHGGHGFMEDTRGGLAESCQFNSSSACLKLLNFHIFPSYSNTNFRVLNCNCANLSGRLTLQL